MQFILDHLRIILLPLICLCAPSAIARAMDEITAQQDVECSAELRQLAQQTLKQNPYRLLSYDQQDDLHLFNALAVSSHRDRDSHVSFYGVKNSDGSCDTSVTESYILQTSCNDARNEAFSKWDFQGKLNARTWVLKSRRNKGKQAFLTNQFGSLCLVTRRELVHNPGS